MNLDDITFSDKHYAMLKSDLKETYDIDMGFFEAQDVSLLESLLIKTDHFRAQLFFESITGIELDSPISMLNEALRVFLKEVYPQKKVKFAENLDYRIDPTTGTTVAGDGVDRPDLYWRENQYKLEKMLTQRLQNPESTPMDFVKFDPRDAHPSDAPSNENNIYVSVLNPNKINGLDGEVLQITLPTEGDFDVPIEPNTDPMPPVNSDTPDSVAKQQDGNLNIPGENKNFNMNKLKEGNMSKIEKMAKLTESVMLTEAELQRAEIVLATKDIVSRLQKQIEDISSMATDDVLPLVDGMKENFGAPTANGFAQKAEDALQVASDSIQSLRDLFDSYARALEKHIGDASAPNDLALDDEVPAPIAPDAEDAGTGDYEMKSPTDALMGESVFIGGKEVKLDENQIAAMRFASQFNKAPMPFYLLTENEKKQLKIAAEIIKGK